MHTYIHTSPKDIKEKILSVTPGSSNIKDSQKHNEYIKELLIENKKSNTLNQEKVLKGIQDQVGYHIGTIIQILEFYGIRKKCYFRGRTQ